MEIPEEKEENKPKKTIQGHFSQEFYLGRDQLAEFLRNLADEVEKQDEIRISTDEWELPFSASERAEVEIDLEDDELEIEIEFEEAKGGTELSAGH